MYLFYIHKDNLIKAVFTYRKPVESLHVPGKNLHPPVPHIHKENLY